VGVESVNAEITTGEELASIIKSCRGFVVGSPTLGGHMPTPVKVRHLRLCLFNDCILDLEAGFSSHGYSVKLKTVLDFQLNSGNKIWSNCQRFHAKDSFFTLLST